jgi:hypothetical protein
MLIRCFQAAKDHNVETTLTTLRAYDKYTDEVVLNSEDGWKKVDIRITSEHVPQLGEVVLCVPFHHRDMVQFLKQQFAKAEYRGHFALAFEKIQDAVEGR